MESCEVCERVNPRCRFGHPSGVCSCWRGIPCVKPDRILSPVVIRALARELPAKEYAR